MTVKPGPKPPDDSLTSDQRYRRSAKGKATQVRYLSSPKGKAALKRANAKHYPRRKTVQSRSKAEKNL